MRIGGARGGGLVASPTLSVEMALRTVFMPSSRWAVSVYEAPASSRRRRMCSPRPGRVGQ